MLSKQLQAQTYRSCFFCVFFVWGGGGGGSDVAIEKRKVILEIQINGVYSITIGNKWQNIIFLISSSVIEKSSLILLHKKGVKFCAN